MASVKPANLLFLLREGQILLAMKKRGFGAGRWNGVGGKPEAGESMEQAVIRECQEEILVTPKKVRQVGEIDFYMADKTNEVLRVFVYVCHEWEGEPQETEEMAPKWFNVNEIPYDDMWSDDRYWLPEVLKGHSVKAMFRLDKDDQVMQHNISVTV